MFAGARHRAPQHREQVGDDGLDVADDRHVGMAVFADLGRIDVGVNHLGPRREGVKLSGHPVVEAGAQRDQQVAALQRRHRSDRAVHAGHAQVLEVRVRERTARHQRGDHRDTGQFRQLGQLLGCLAADDAAAHVQHRFARSRDQLGRLTNLLAVRFGVRFVAGQVHFRRPTERALTLQHILGDVDEHRARTSRGRDVEGLGHHPRNVVAGANQEVVLGDRHGDAGDVGLLEGVRADQRTADLPCHGDHRDRVHLRVGQWRHQVGGTGTRSRHAHPDLARRVRVATGGVAGALLVADQHVAQLFRVEQRVVDGEHGTAGNPEDDLDVEFLQRPDYRLCAGELHRCNSLRLGRSRFCGGLHGVLRAVGRLGRLWLGRCAHCGLVSPLSLLWKVGSDVDGGHEKTPVSSCCTRVARWCWFASNAEELVRHQRAD